MERYPIIFDKLLCDINKLKPKQKEIKYNIETMKHEFLKGINQMLVLSLH